MTNGLEISQDLVIIRKARMILKDKRDNMFFIGISTTGRFIVVMCVMCTFIDSPPDSLINFTSAVPSSVRTRKLASSEHLWRATSKEEHIQRMRRAWLKAILRLIWPG